MMQGRNVYWLVTLQWLAPNSATVKGQAGAAGGSSAPVGGRALPRRRGGDGNNPLRTAGKLEVDLILEPQDALLAFEMKSRTVVSRRDAGPIERARRILGERYQAGVVVYRGDRVERLTETVFAIPDWWLLGFEE